MMSERSVVPLRYGGDRTSTFEDHCGETAMTRTRSSRREWLTGAAAVALGSGSVALGQPGPAKIPITGRAMPRLKRFDSVMVELIERHGFPGASLAMAKEGRLVFARGYGFADLKNRTTVRPAMQFGIGSVSKTITAVAVLKLFESGKLRLDDRAFEILSDLKPLEGARVDFRSEHLAAARNKPPGGAE
jgi:CubicO group peptidase (beta-lactamase class C family)